MTMSKFEITSNDGIYRFNLYAKNNRVIGRSSEGYNSREGSITGIKSVIENANAEIVDLTKEEEKTGSRYEVFYSSDKYWFRLKAANGETILASQGYTTKESCLNGIESVKINAPTAIVEELITREIPLD